MVKPLPIIFALFLLVAFVASVSPVQAAGTYTVDHEWVQIAINGDGTIDLTYNITIHMISGSLTGYYVGQPNSDFTIGKAFDQFGRSLTVDKITDNGYLADVWFAETLLPGDTLWFNVTTNVGGMISNDDTNPGNYGMLFTPQWDTSFNIHDVRTQILLPVGLTNVSDVKTTQNFWNSSSIVNVDGDRLALYWEKDVIGTNNQYSVGVSFPSKYLPNYTPNQFPYWILIPIIFFIIIIIALIAVMIRKKPYTSPKLSMESLGIRRGLTAVEASYMLDLKPKQIVTEMIYSLLQKRAIWAEATKPSLKLRILPPYQDKTGPTENPLRYYEIDFLNAIKLDGSLDETKLAKTVTFMENAVEQKMRGYSRKETVDYYRSIVAKAWTQVEQAGTVDVASNAYDEQLLWLLLDPNQQTKTQTIFQNRTFTPNPLWFWYWYGYTYYHPHPTFHPNINKPSQSGPAPQIPGADFANSIATSIESTANNFVVNIEKFANSIVPPPQAVTTSHQPAGKGANCACACASCACACACVSCACACAGGGGH